MNTTSLQPDGFIDLFVPNTTADWGPSVNFLYRNNRDGTFVPALAGLVGAVATDKDMSYGGYWGDFNNDGFLDLFVANGPPNANSPAVASRLYLGQATGAFVTADGRDLTQPVYNAGWSAVADYDNDGWLDVFRTAAWAENGRRTNLLYHGRGDATFRLVTNCIVATDRSDYSNNGVWGDYDNDGFLDLAAGGGSSTRLFRNDGGHDFVLTTNWPAADWAAPAWADYDNDGHLDLLMIRGQSTPRQVRLFRNTGVGTFTQVEEAFTQPLNNWMGGGWGDYDNDGFLDLFLAEHRGQNALYHNEGNGNHWLKIQLEGRVSNGAAIGAKVRVKATISGQTVWQLREVSGGNFCQNDLRPHFGLGDATVAEVVRVEWPSGNVQEYTDQPVDRIMKIIEGARIYPLRPTVSLGGSVTLRTVSWTGTRQWQFNGVDLAGETNVTLSLTNVQPTCQGRYSLVLTDEDGTASTSFAYLLVDPQFTKITTESPVTDLGCSWGASWGDPDGDGFADLFVARSGNAALYHNDQDGTFTTMTNGPFPLSAGAWTSGAWADFDNDGRQDLLATRWGKPALLYFNEGNGSSSPFEFAPTGNWGVAVADYNQDGLLDVLLSTGVTASAGAPCVLFRNNGDRTFTKTTQQEAGRIVSATSFGAATWADYDDDGLVDAFSPVFTGGSLVFHNEGKGRFVSATNEVTKGSQFIAGAWGDYDHDGFLDLYISNGNDPRTTKTANFFCHNNGNDNRWLQVRLVGTVSNRDGVGAKVRVRAAYGGQMRWQRRDISGGDGYNGNHRYAHFGLGTAPRATQVRLEWPSGIVQEMSNVPANQILTVTEPPALEALGEGRIRLLCWARQSYEVEASDDLQTWTSLGVVATEVNRPVVLDPGATGHPYRFYRAKGH